jgi:uncharacterized protein with HEPN domain
MQPEDRDAALLWDMRESAKEVVEFVRGVSFVEFSRDKKLRYAVERQLMVIGEAASRVSAAFMADHPDIPWKSMIGQRNVLAHEYGEVLVERVWRVAAERLPELLRQIEPLIPPAPPDDRTE